jgi:hypothetical protein
MQTLKELEGTQISLLAPFLHVTKFHKVKLHLVEDSGIWIESQDVTETLLDKFSTSMSPKTAVFFIPWSGVTTIMGSLDVPSISRAAL